MGRATVADGPRHLAFWAQIAGTRESGAALCAEVHRSRKSLMRFCTAFSCI